MAKKIWQKTQGLHPMAEAFTVGDDRKWDLFLAPFDVLGSLAHAQMLSTIGLLEEDELQQLQEALKGVFQDIQSGQFEIQEGVEDVHSQVELLLTERLGAIGKKIHAARSRNDQVLVDLKLYFRSELEQVLDLTVQLALELLHQAEIHRDKLLPGYTHFQAAMPSSAGLWLGAYSEALVDDLSGLHSAFQVINRNPLGSAAGYGSNFPIDRTLTTQLLGFDGLHVSSVYAQMGRGKTELLFAEALANIGSTLNRLSADMCWYMSQDLGFVAFPEAWTTGSSIMPHKKNPDVWEILRGKTNEWMHLPQAIRMAMANLPAGYHRDTQLIKARILPTIEDVKQSLRVSREMLKGLEVKEGVLNQDKYQLVHSVERVNALVQEGMPFRDAYRQVGQEIADGCFTVPEASQYTHIGSIGNPGLDEIRKHLENKAQAFDFNAIHEAEQSLLS